MQIDTSKSVSIITLAALASLLVFITSNAYAQKQIVQQIVIATGTATSSISPLASNITLNPNFNYAGYDKTIISCIIKASSQL